MRTMLTVLIVTVADLVSVAIVRNDEFLSQDVSETSAGSLGHHRAWGGRGRDGGKGAGRWWIVTAMIMMLVLKMTITASPC